jgi:formylglycine-generating enzyme required for sulfatase activity
LERTVDDRRQIVDMRIAKVRVESVTTTEAGAIVEWRSAYHTLRPGQRIEWITELRRPLREESEPVQSAERESTPGEVRIFGGMQFVWIPAGTFEMGSHVGEEGRGDNEGPRHRVTVPRGFWLGKYEVTQGQWEAVMGNNPSFRDDCGGNCPVEQVSWGDVLEFIDVLNAREAGDPYRLPTEVEWEYAARAGTTGPRHGDLERVAWYDGNSGGTPRPVGTKQPNAWGLHDMLGNVWEWTADWYRYYPSWAAIEPKAPASWDRVIRGGSWDSDGAFCRSASRAHISSSTHFEDTGFRLARDPQ